MKRSKALLLGFSVLGLLIFALTNHYRIDYTKQYESQNRESISSHYGSKYEAAKTGPMLMEFSSPYCPSCRKTAPLIEKLTDACPKQGINVIQYDASNDENSYLVQQLSIQVLPSVVFFDESGNEVARLEGIQTEETIASYLKKIGGQACLSV